MKIAIITTDNREPFRQYDKTEPWFGTAPSALLHGLSLYPEEVEIHVISCTQRPMNSPAKLAENIWFHSLHVPKIGWLRTAYAGCVLKIRQKLREISPDVVHAQGTERECAISAALSPYPALLTIHGNMRQIARLYGAPLFSYKWLQAHLENFVLPRFDGVVCITNYTKGQVGDRAGKTWTIPNAVDPTYFDIPRVPSDTPEFLYIATIAIHKNQVAFLDAIAPLAQKHQFHVRCVGGIEENSGYAALFKERLKIYPWCSHGGLYSTNQLQESLTTASGVLLPSLEDNCPMAILEAMAAGVPVMAANIGGIPDLVQNDTGLLCDPSNPASMAEVFEEFLSNCGARKQRAIEGRRRAKSHHHPRQVARHHLDIYRETISNKAK